MSARLQKVLIANRGEIACRIIRTAKRLGIGTVAVYFEADKTALHVEMADEAVRLGRESARGSYLDGAAIIAAAKETGTDAIHPGYGFLSEAADFAEAVVAAGLIFVGPSADAIRQMGLKGDAKALMQKAGVPVVPGYHGAEQDTKTLQAEAAKIGYPLLIKAVAGGGGKGMRVVASAEMFAAALAAARNEAMAAFGNSDVLLERLIDTPRHIEIQIFGDGDHVVHLFERECSLQRRHQKVIEEAPAPGMTPEMREAMTKAACRAAKAVGYRGAGTVEFIVDASDGLSPDRFWFMEMNTRLQVEHPVTEAVTGVDLVEWQFRVASGAPLPLDQSEIKLSGHVVEARLYAENVAAGFLPATGPLDHLVFPDGPRIEAGVRQGDRITADYDPMIAKIITQAVDRATAIDRLRQALEGVELVGTETNLAFLRRLLGHPDVIDGHLDTGLIARNIDVLSAPPPPSDAGLAVAAVASLGALPVSHRGFSLWTPLRRRVQLGETSVACEVAPKDVVVDLNGRVMHVTSEGARWFIDGRDTRLRTVLTETHIHVFGPGGAVIDLPDPLDRSETTVGDGTILAPMPGRVTQVLHKIGARVRAGETLLSLEAMKMEHALTAPQDGLIRELNVAPGSQVEAGAILVVIDDRDQSVSS